MQVNMTSRHASEYDKFLNEVYGSINLCGFTYPAATLFYNGDPVAYEAGMCDFEERMYDSEDFYDSLDGGNDE